MRSITDIFNLDGFAISFCQEEKKAYIFLNPADYFLLPNAAGLSHEIKNKNLSQLNIWLENHKLWNDFPSVFGFLSYETFYYTENISVDVTDIHGFPSALLVSYGKVISIDYDLNKHDCASLPVKTTWQLTDYEESKVIDYVKSLIKKTHLKNTSPKKHINPAEYTTKNECEKFLAGVESIKNQILQGNVYQANLSLPFTVSSDKNNDILFADILSCEQGGFSCYFNCGFFKEECSIISNSPELFIKKEGSCLCAAPIKGTIKACEDKTKNDLALKQLTSSAKDLAELAMIVDLFRNDFGKFAQIGSVKVSTFPQTLTLNHLHHLYCHITALANNESHDMDVILSCFPSGSITGAPKYTALKIISELEQTSRDVYCGCFLAFKKGSFYSSVGIRTLIKQKTEIYLRAGCGVTIDSTADDELNEAFVKAQGLLQGIIK